MNEYTISGREVYSAKGKLVATLDDDGNPVMVPGMAGPHRRNVEAFLAAQEEPPRITEPPQSYTSKGRRGDEAEEPPKMPEYEPPVTEENPAPAPEGGTNVYVGQIPARRAEGGAPEETPRPPETLEEYSISTIPDDELPPFSKELGVNTPGFEGFVKLHKLTAPQIAALVKRLAQ